MEAHVNEECIFCASAWTFALKFFNWEKRPPMLRLMKFLKICRIAAGKPRKSALGSHRDL